ncbi:uncharacterized protein LOC122664915 [Telopea speciosissima]|uniref:uncharacterized protein LOC122664915 n=1 Tax=Telopea speciosissima TaxID=54955 RepID=UPI001CC5B2ED|nr:uncharacterized protein LOC122664915 [Telopea speciosissima]
MDKSKWSTRALIVSLFIIIISHELMIISTVGDAGGDDQGPNAVERSINFKTPFQKLTSLIKLAWVHFRIPDSERIKEGGSNAKAAGDVAHEAAEKVKRTISSHHDEQEKEL